MELLLTGVVVTVLVVISALCSGLNVALMALDPDDLRRKSKAGDSQATRALSIRNNTHLSLSSILLTNVAVISAVSLFLESVFIGVVAGIISTILIVIFGEVLPQAIFGRQALKFVSRFAGFLKVLIVLSYPLAKPLQWLLDKLLGDQKSNMHSRAELGIILTEHLHTNESELDDDEVEIMRGALSLSEKRVREILTPIENVYCLELEDMLNATRIDELKERAFSRVPVFDAGRTKCHGMLIMKDLVDHDFDAHPLPLNQVPLRPVKTVGSMTALDTLLRKFINSRSHLVAVEKEGAVIGIATIEDLIEEIIGHEIEDESHKQQQQTAAEISESIG